MNNLTELQAIRAKIMGVKGFNCQQTYEYIGAILPIRGQARSWNTVKNWFSPNDPGITDSELQLLTFLTAQLGED